MRFGSLFAGIGGFDLAFERVGMTPQFQVEIDARCRALLADRFDGVKLYDDIKEVESSGLPDIDLLCGGFPCQDISNAGRRAGLAGERSGLWWEFHRLLREVRPTWCVIENVAGLLSSGQRRDLGAILGALGDLGYGFAYRVLDAQWFGVAQRRRRVFIVGHLGDGRAPARVLLEPEGSPGDSPPSREAGSAVAALTRNGVGTCGADDNQAQAGHLVVLDKPTPLYYTHDYNQDRIYDGAGISEALTTARRPNFYVEQMVRRLTPLECERLQGFPDGWTEGFSDAQRYRMLGNAVAVPVVEWIGRRIMEEAG